LTKTYEWYAYKLMTLLTQFRRNNGNYLYNNKVLTPLEPCRCYLFC